MATSAYALADFTWCVKTARSLQYAASAAQRDQLARLPTVTLHESDYRLEWMAEPWRDVQVRAGMPALVVDDVIVSLEAGPDIIFSAGTKTKTKRERDQK